MRETCPLCGSTEHHRTGNERWDDEFFTTDGDWHQCLMRCPSHNTEKECKPHAAYRLQRERAERAEARIEELEKTCDRLLWLLGQHDIDGQYITKDARKTLGGEG